MMMGWRKSPAKTVTAKYYGGEGYRKTVAFPALSCLGTPQA
jgi:hypothetical protein